MKERSQGIPGTYVLDAIRSRLGYVLNKLGYSLAHAENRDLYRQDEATYLRALGNPSA